MTDTHCFLSVVLSLNMRHASQLLLTEAVGLVLATVANLELKFCS